GSPVLGVLDAASPYHRRRLAIRTKSAQELPPRHLMLAHPLRPETIAHSHNVFASARARRSGGRQARRRTIGAAEHRRGEAGVMRRRAIILGVLAATLAGTGCLSCKHHRGCTSNRPCDGCSNSFTPTRLQPVPAPPQRLPPAPPPIARAQFDTPAPTPYR